MVFNDTFGEVEVGDAISVISWGSVVCVRTVRAVDDGLFRSQLGVSGISTSVICAYSEVTNAILVLLHRAVLERLSG